MFVTSFTQKHYRIYAVVIKKTRTMLDFLINKIADILHDIYYCIVYIVFSYVGKLNILQFLPNIYSIDCNRLKCKIVFVFLSVCISRLLHFYEGIFIYSTAFKVFMQIWDTRVCVL